MMSKLTDKLGLVTGALHGIREGIVLALATLGLGSSFWSHLSSWRRLMKVVTA